MDINEYIQDNLHLLFNSKYTKYDKIFHPFQREMERKYGIKTIEIYSTSIFPKQISMNSEWYYLSDNHFWNMFEHYLMAYFLCSGRLSIGIDYNNLREMISSMTLIAMANLQDNHPYLSLSFAQAYQMHGMRMGDYGRAFFDTGRISDIESIVCFSYIGVFLHEIAHKRYNNLNSTQNGFDNFMKMLRALPSSESTTDQSIRNAVREVECLIYLGDKKGLEELYCDFTSMVSVVELVIKKCSDVFTLDECVKLTMESIMLPTIFRVFLLQNQLYWERAYYQFRGMDSKVRKTSDKIKKLHTETMARNSFMYLVAQGILFDKYVVDDSALNIKEVTEFDDVSQYLLTSWYSFDILQREKYNSEKYSLYEARELRNKILKWNPK